jgi:PAS domain-containing protein
MGMETDCAWCSKPRKVKAGGARGMCLFCSAWLHGELGLDVESRLERLSAPAAIVASNGFVRYRNAAARRLFGATQKLGLGRELDRVARLAVAGRRCERVKVTAKAGKREIPMRVTARRARRTVLVRLERA